MSASISLLTEIISNLIQSASGAQSVIKSRDITKIQEETRIQELNSFISEKQVKVLQELAIARRIDTAEEVEIEEFYDSIGKGYAGFSADEAGYKIGIGGEGERVTKRIYRFRGYREGSSEIDKRIDEMIGTDNKE